MAPPSSSGSAGALCLTERWFVSVRGGCNLCPIGSGAESLHPATVEAVLALAAGRCPIPSWAFDGLALD